MIEAAAVDAQPFTQITASATATALFPVPLLGSVWYILFNVIAGALAIEGEFREVGNVLNFGRNQRWTTIIIPAIFPYLVLITAPEEPPGVAAAVSSGGDALSPGVVKHQALSFSIARFLCFVRRTPATIKPMLKIGSIRWRGKCARHPSFDPYVDGRGAIKGACAKCTALVEIHESHQKMIALMRSFAPPQPIRKSISAFDRLQASLFTEE